MAFRYVLDVRETVQSLAPVVKNSNTSVVQAIAKSGTKRRREIFCKHSSAADKMWYCSLPFIPRENNSWNSIYQYFESQPRHNLKTVLLDGTQFRP